MVIPSLWILIRFTDVGVEPATRSVAIMPWRLALVILPNSCGTVKNWISCASIPIEFCNIVIEKDFDRLLDLKQTADPHGIERFCKYDINIHLSLVWVKRLF